MVANRPSLIEFASIKDGRDITRGWVNAIGNYLPTTDEILLTKGGGDLKLYEAVLQDDQVKSCLQQRFRAVTSHEWEVLPGGEKRIDKQAATHLEQQLKAIKWDDCNEKMLYGVHYGFSAAEILWGRDGDNVCIADIRVRDRRRFEFDIDQNLTLKTYGNPLGEALPDKKFWHFSVGADHDDEPHGRGLAHWLYWPTFFKRNGVKWWMRFLELFASPARKGTYPAGSSKQEKDILWDALASFGFDDRMMIPEGLAIEFLESSRNGTVDYKSLCDQMDAAIAKIILSQTMTTDNGSSRSQAEVHQDVADSVIESDADLICDSFNNSVVKWLTDWNFPGAAYPKVWRKLESDPDLGVLADTDTKLQGLGISLKPEAIASRYGEEYLIPENKDSTPQLNVEQVNVLVSIVSNAKSGGWSPELVTGLINAAFPNWSDTAVAAITSNLGDSTGGDAQYPNSQSLDTIAAEFAAAKVLAFPGASLPPKRKQCQKGLSCGASCISPTKKCKKELSIPQKSNLERIKSKLKVLPGGLNRPPVVPPTTLPTERNRDLKSNGGSAEILAMGITKEDVAMLNERRARIRAVNKALESKDLAAAIRIAKNEGIELEMEAKRTLRDLRRALQEMDDRTNKVLAKHPLIPD
jgi:phage gp29-like protein